MFVALEGSELALGTGTTPAPPQQVPINHFLAPAFVQTLVQELAVYTFFWPIVWETAATLGRTVNWQGAAALKALLAPPGGTFLMLCCLPYRWGQLAGRCSKMRAQLGWSFFGRIYIYVYLENYDCGT
jgi:hypothetical protein